MPITPFPNGLSSFGVPLLGGIGGIPFTGNYFFLDPVNGNDGNEGDAPDNAKATLAVAFALLTSGNNDVLVLIGDGTITATAELDSNLAWNKNAAHMVGVAAPTYVSQRARIAPSSGNDFSPMVTVTGDGCYFANFSTFHDQLAADGICWADQGERNYYGNVQFGGMGTQAAADDAASRSLVIGTGGNGEHTFEHCTIGLDTVDRGAANASLEFIAGSPRNVFKECLFPMRRDAAEPTHVLIGAVGIDRFVWFKDCFFNNFGSDIAEVIAANAAAGGNVLVDPGCAQIGATSWRNGAGLVFVAGAVPTAATSGIAVAAT